MKPKFLIFLVIVTVCFKLTPSHANNLNISAPSVSGSDLTFTISWENSWYVTSGPGNWDAAWVFVKYQDCSNGLWSHANLSTNSADHSTSSPLQVDAVSDGKGVFIHRSTAGSGNITSTTVTLKLSIAAGTYNFKVFGTEMVNIPQGAFDIGDATIAGAFNPITINASYQTTGVTASTLGGSSVNVPGTYPMGYNSFYCMKYEITQEQYVDFLNTLTYTQQSNRVAVLPNVAAGANAFASGDVGNGIEIMTPGVANTSPAVFACDYTDNGVYNASNDAQNAACNYLSWEDLLAFQDWAALRPMSDMEFEKICRGTLPRVAGEYPWANTTINPTSAQYNITLSGTASESSTYLPCNYYYSSSYFKSMRVGFAATGASTRSTSGATYYGVLEMGGNVHEQVVSVANSTAIAYTGTLGDGTLTSNGLANSSNWPVAANCSGLRGGSLSDGIPYIRVSDRSTSPYTLATNYRIYNKGGRGLR